MTRRMQVLILGTLAVLASLFLVYEVGTPSAKVVTPMVRTAVSE